MRSRTILAVLALAITLFTFQVSRADILATAYFTGQILRYSPEDATFTTFAQVDPGTDPFPGLSGIFVDNVNNHVYATARESNRIYQFDGTSGAIVNLHQLASDSSPTGILYRDGLVYVANNGGNSVSVFDSSFALQSTIALPDLDPTTIPIDANLPSGLAFSGDQLLISTFAGAGVYSHDFLSGNTTVFNNQNPVANNQIAVAGDGSVVVGSAAFSSSLYFFDSSGNATGTIDIDSTVLPPPPFPFLSPNQTSPAGVSVDADGNLIVAALGRTNPFFETDNFQSNGGLFKFSSDGTLLETYGVGLTPLSAVAVITAVPEPSSVVALVAFTAIGWRKLRRAKRKI